MIRLIYNIKLFRLKPLFIFILQKEKLWQNKYHIHLNSAHIVLTLDKFVCLNKKYIFT